MNIYLNALLISVTTFLFSGCTSSSFNLDHDKNSKTTTIIIDDKSYVLIDSEKIRDENRPKNGATRDGGSIIESYTSQDVNCKNIQYSEYQKLDGRRHYNTTSKEDTYKNNDNRCTTEKINNVYYHDCYHFNAITNDIYGSSGVIQKKYLLIEDKKCFYKLRDLAKGEKIIQE